MTVDTTDTVNVQDGTDNTVPPIYSATENGTPATLPPRTNNPKSHPSSQPPTPPTPVHHPLLQLGCQHSPSHPGLTRRNPHPPLRVLLQTHTLHDGALYHSHAAEVILPVREEGDLFLCTLLLGNVAVNTLLGMMMVDITNGAIGFLMSTGLVRVFIL